MDYHGYITHNHGTTFPKLYGCSWDGITWGANFTFQPLQIGMFCDYHFQYNYILDAGYANISTPSKVMRIIIVQ